MSKTTMNDRVKYWKMVAKKNIRERRIDSNLTQRELALKMEVSIDYIQRIETERRLPNMNFICRAAEAYKIKPSTLLIDRRDTKEEEVIGNEFKS